MRISYEIVMKTCIMELSLVVLSMVKGHENYFMDCVRSIAP